MTASPEAHHDVRRAEIARARRFLDAVVSEKELQTLVLELASLRGWTTYHTFDSRRSAPGFPDVIAVRRGRCLAIELKSETGRMTPEQQRWLFLLGQVPGVEGHLWRPSDLSSGLIEEWLR